VGPVRVAVIDDDRWRRAAMARQLDAHVATEVVLEADHDRALRLPAGAWSEVDVALVDVFDELAPAEVGTDLYSGIMTLAGIRRLPVRTIAIVPHSGNALLRLRVHECGADSVYFRWELNDIEPLVAAITTPDPGRAPRRPDAEELSAYGTRINAHVNEAIHHYEQSPLYGQVGSETTQSSLGLPRRAVDRFRTEVSATGFDGTEIRSGATRRVIAPRWPDVRDHVLRLLGRKDARHTEHD
jgi:hypothetical protein